MTKATTKATWSRLLVESACAVLRARQRPRQPGQLPVQQQRGLWHARLRQPKSGPKKNPQRNPEATKTSSLAQKSRLGLLGQSPLVPLPPGLLRHGPQRLPPDRQPPPHIPPLLRQPSLLRVLRLTQPCPERPTAHRHRQLDPVTSRIRLARRKTQVSLRKRATPHHPPMYRYLPTTSTTANPTMRRPRLTRRQCADRPSQTDPMASGTRSPPL